MENKKDIFLGQPAIEQVKNIDDNFNELFDSVDGLDYSINNSGFITKDVNNLTNYTLKSETGTDIELSLDTTTYIMTLKLKNASGTDISTATIDFPIESLVVNASYADGTLTLKLKNGTTLDVDISALISGLVPETRKINGKALTNDITLTQDDIDFDMTKHSQFELANETDLNTLCGDDKVGWYYCQQGAGYHPNAPLRERSLNAPFHIEVLKTSDDDSAQFCFAQIFHGRRSWIRRLSGATWSEWEDYAFYSDIPSASTTAPKMDGTASYGSSADYARADHVHPTDTTRASTAVATTSANGLMSKTDKSNLDTVVSKHVRRFTVSVAENDSKYTALTIDGLTYYGYPIGDDDESFDITGVWNSSGLGVVYQEYRYNSFNYVLVSSKMALTISYIVRCEDM